MLEDVRIRLLGPVTLVPPDAGPSGTKQQLLLAVLALDVGSTVAADRLVDALWAGRPTGDPVRSLQVHVSKLRGTLDTAGVEASIRHSSGGYVLDAPAGAVDAVACEALVEEAVGLLDDDPSRARALLAAVLGAFRGTPLAGLGDGPVVAEARRRLVDLRVRAHEARITADLALGRHAEVVDEVRALVDEQPFREPLWQLLLRALSGADRQAEALTAYEEVRRLFAEELGADPSPSLQALHRRVLEQDPTLTAPAGASPAAAAPADVDARPPDSVAVLPFEVIGGGAGVADLAVGLHADLVTELTRASDLTVISRSSVLPYRGGTRTPREVGAELGVGAVVEGTVQSAADRVRLTVQLVDTRGGQQLWAERYDRALTAERLFTLQMDLAADIARALWSELEPRAAAAGELPTASLEAWRMAAAARRHFDQKTHEGFRQAVESYQRAVELDPTYVDAWTGLADALVSQHAYGHGDDPELLVGAQRAVHRAISLDPLAPRARTSLGALHVAHQDAAAAIGELEHALRLQPGQADALNWLTWVTLLVGRPAVALAERATELDPLGVEAHAHLALAYAGAGRAADGLAAARRAGELSSYGTAVLYEAACLHELGRHEAVIALLTPLACATGGPGVQWAEPGPDALLALAHAARGRPAQARQVLAGLGEDDAGHLAAGLVHLALGEAAVARARFDRVGHLTAWSCLVVHQFHDRLWSAVPDEHRRMVAVAHRSWGLEREQSPT